MRSLCFAYILSLSQCQATLAVCRQRCTGAILNVLDGEFEDVIAARLFFSCIVWLCHRGDPSDRG